MTFIGVDLHSNSFTVCRLEADGREAFETYSLCTVDLERFCTSLDAGDEIAFEATGNASWFRDQVLGAGVCRACCGGQSWPIWRDPQIGEEDGQERCQKNDIQGVGFLS